MTFQPVLPIGGLAGWSLLNRTMERQTELFNQSPQIVRDTAYFEKTIGDIKTADDLVSDRRLLRVALGAFGLQEDIDSRAFIRTIIEEGTTRDDALAKFCTKFPAWVHQVASLSLLLALRIKLLDRAFASSSSAHEELRHWAELHKNHIMRY